MNLYHCTTLRLERNVIYVASSKVVQWAVINLHIVNTLEQLICRTKFIKGKNTSLCDHIYRVKGLEVILFMIIHNVLSFFIIVLNFLLIFFLDV